MWDSYPESPRERPRGAKVLGSGLLSERSFGRRDGQDVAVSAEKTAAVGLRIRWVADQGPWDACLRTA